MRIAQIGAAEALASLHSCASGLASAEASRRLIEFGPNRIEEIEERPLALRFARQFTHFFAIILWIAAGLAFFAEVHDPGKSMATLGFAILGVILVNGAFSFWQEYRAERAISALKALLPRLVTALREGAACRIPVETLVPGDVILVQAGDDIPADCRVTESFGLRANMATLTGESLPKPRSAEPSEQIDPLRSRNLLLAGTSIAAGEGRAVVFATGMRTEFGRIAHLTQSVVDPPTPLQREIARLSRLIAIVSIALGAVFFVIGRYFGLGFWETLLFAIGVIVANVPEGLLPTVTLSLAMATQRMARRNALIRHLPAAEALGSATVICTDKTGTLTQNRMSAKRFFCADGALGSDELDGTAHRAHRSLIGIARHCHNLREISDNGRPALFGDPTEVALVEMARAASGAGSANPRLDELPFDADRMRMSTLHATPSGAVLYCKGATEVVVPLCTHLDTAEGPAPLGQVQRERFLAAQVDMAEQGLRVLALAWRVVPDGELRERWEERLVLAGLVGLEDPPRPEVPGAIAQCRTAGIRVIMVTGDHPRTARAIAAQIGLAHSPTVVPGDTLRRMSDTQLQLALDAPEILFARVTADQKMRIVDALKRKGHVVAVTGDGVNDAPALKRADIGIAMGIAGTDVARESADMILLDDNFASIVAAIEEGRAVYQNIRKFLTYVLASNIPELVPYLAFVLFRIPLPLTIIQILAVDLGTDMLPALALGAEKPDPQGMHRPPRDASERLLDRGLLARAYLWLGIMEAAAAMAAFFFVLDAGGWKYGDLPGSADPLYLQSTAACLAAIIVMQVVNVFLCRDPRRSAFAPGWSGNPLILAGIAVEIALMLAIVYTPWGQAMFGTAALAPEAWRFMLPFALGMLLLEEARKLIMRVLARRSEPRAG